MLARVLFVFFFLLTACQSTNPSISSIPNTPTPVTETTSIPSYNLEYRSVFKDDNFEIREAFLEAKDLSKFVWLPTRINETVTNYDPPIKVTGDDWCASLKQTGWCSQDITTSGKNKFVLQCDSGTFERNCKLYRNDHYVWQGHMNGGLGFPIESIKKIGDEISISYVDANTDNGFVDYIIVLSKPDSFLETKNAYSPNEILGKLLFFRHDTDKEVMIFDGKDIAEYDAILHWPCCGGGYNININSNGKIVDFFAQKGNAWYHVQAGDASYLASLRTEGK